MAIEHIDDDGIRHSFCDFKVGNGGTPAAC
jgi:hypothetical protein